MASSTLLLFDKVKTKYLNIKRICPVEALQEFVSEQKTCRKQILSNKNTSVCITKTFEKKSEILFLNEQMAVVSNELNELHVKCKNEDVPIVKTTLITLDEHCIIFNGTTPLSRTYLLSQEAMDAERQIIMAPNVPKVSELFVDNSGISTIHERLRFSIENLKALKFETATDFSLLGSGILIVIGVVVMWYCRYYQNVHQNSDHFDHENDHEYAHHAHDDILRQFEEIALSQLNLPHLLPANNQERPERHI